MLWEKYSLQQCRHVVIVAFGMSLLCVLSKKFNNYPRL